MTKKERLEKALVGKFLRSAGVRFRCIRTVSEFSHGHRRDWPSGPDTKVEYWDGNAWRRIGIEVTTYQVDPGKHGSASRRWQDLWARVYRILRCNYFWRYREFHRFTGTVTFAERHQPPRSREIPFLARRIARELIALLRPELPRIKCGARTRFMSGRYSVDGTGAFVGFQHLEKWVDEVRVLRRRPFLRGPFSWSRSQTGHIGLIPRLVASTIRKKAKKRVNYELADTDECWLLICATGQTGSDRAGPSQFARQRLQDKEITEAAAASCFHRIIFWERPRGWHLDVKQACGGEESLMLSREGHKVVR